MNATGKSFTATMFLLDIRFLAGLSLAQSVTPMR
jgi:hypothetical protein